MFSRNRGSKPIGRRPPSAQEYGAPPSIETNSSNPPEHRIRVNDPPTARPLALPKIPRVASQYGAHGPVSMSELERKLMNFALEEEEEGEVNYTDKSKSRLETIQDTETRLTGATRAEESAPHIARAASPRRPSTSNSNFSRPLRPPRRPSDTLHSRHGSNEKTPSTGLPAASAPVEIPVTSPPTRILAVSPPTSRSPPKPVMQHKRQYSNPSFTDVHTTSPPALRTQFSAIPTTRPSAPILAPPPLARPFQPEPSQQTPLLQRPQTAPSNPLPPTQSTEIGSWIKPLSSQPPNRDDTFIRPGSRDGPLPIQTARNAPPRSHVSPALMPPPAEMAPEPLPNNRPASSRRTTEDSANSASFSTYNLETSKPSKSVRSRFNPISLITRRKTGQSTRPAPTETFPPPLPADYDPRIRGNVIHDFSAPRFKPVDSSRPQIRGPGLPQGLSSHRPDMPMQRNTEPVLPSTSSQNGQVRTPVFKEHFGDDTDAWRLDESDQRNKDTTGIASRVPEHLPVETMSSLPAFARRTPPNTFTPSTYTPPPPPREPLPPIPPELGSAPKAVKSDDIAAAPQLSVPEPPTHAPPPIVSEPKASTPQPATPESNVHKSSVDAVPNATLETPAAQTRSRSPSGSSTGLLSPTPARLKSNASSRFSFDLAGVGSIAQEKLLEEKHRQRNAPKARESIVSEVSIVETDDENGYDDMDMDGFAEDIPGMDSDDEPFPVAGNVADFTLPSKPDTTPSKLPSRGLNSAWSLSQPFEVLPEDSQPQPLTAVPTLSDDAFKPPGGNTESRVNEIQQQLNRGNFVNDDADDDDLYFDDGMIDDIDFEDGETFDESVFDDENNTVYGKPLRDQKKSPPPDVGHSDSSQQSTRPMSLESSAQAALNAKATADTSRTSVQPPDPGLITKRAPTLDRMPQAHEDTSLTKDNLAAYHDALAFAANKAAREGRFDRKQSMDKNFSDDEIRPRVSFNNQDQVVTMVDDDVLDFDFDDLDNLDDEAIAAANAEALENDDEGFYGQEFGFFARGDEAEYINGGYFGSGFNDMVKRSHSGRGKDPSLTPITERSEWSQRNSMISLALAGSYSALPTPGLAQLADSLQYEDDNMSLSALMKLRRGAFGDSTTSLPSSAGSLKSGSSQTFTFPQPPSTTGIPRNHSASSLAMPPPELPARLQQHPSAAPPARRPVSRGHSRTSSAGESFMFSK